MINSYMSRMTKVMTIALAMVVSACKPVPGPEVEVEPVFPTAVEKTVAPGETVTLTFDANMDWEVSVPENSLTTFWIEDGAMDVAKVSGMAGEGIAVVIGTTASEEFDERSCEVSMKMGDKTQKIATVILPAKERTLTLYTADVTDGEIHYNDEGDYLFGTDEAKTVNLIWTGYDFRLPVKIDANFSWTVKTPSWARVDVPEDRIGEVSLNIMGVPSEYPLDDARDKLVFMSGDTVIKEYDISIPGCMDIFSYSVAMGLTELVFDHAGGLKVATGFVENPAYVTVSGTFDVGVVAFEFADGRYDVNSGSPSWLVVESEEYDVTEGADVIQTRNVEISVTENEGYDREAVIFFLPPAAAGLEGALFNDAGDTIKEDYVQYAVRVTQLSSDQEFVMMLSSSSEMAAAGASFAVADDENLLSKFGETRYAYDLVYTNQYARDYARMTFTSAVTSYRLFGAVGTDKTDAEDFFLSLTLDEDKKSGVIDMISETESFGYVVLYGSTDNVLAVIRCTYDPDAVIVDETEIGFVGESEMYAPMVGATLEKLTEGAIFDQYTDGMSPVYHLKYTMAGMPMAISIPSGVRKHDVNPWALQYNIRVNDTVYSETFVNDMLGGIELIDGGVVIYMEMPEDKDFMRGNINFRAADDTVLLILVCTMDLSGSGE